MPQKSIYNWSSRTFVLQSSHVATFFLSARNDRVGDAPYVRRIPAVFPRGVITRWHSARPARYLPCNVTVYKPNYELRSNGQASSFVNPYTSANAATAAGFSLPWHSASFLHRFSTVHGVKTSLNGDEPIQNKHFTFSLQSTPYVSWWLGQPQSATNFSIPNSPIPSPITFSSVDSRLCSSITPHSVHSRLKTYHFFYKTFLPYGFRSPLRTAFRPFLLSFSVFVLWFLPYFFVLGLCRALD